MLYESNWFNLQFLKYAPLFLGLSILTLMYPIITDGEGNSWFALIVVGMLSGIFFLIFFLIKDKLKFVIIGKTKLIVKESKQVKQYNWLDVEQIKLIRFLKLYKLKLKGEEVFYFTAYGAVSLWFGDLSDMGVIIEKMKKELSI